MGFVSAFGRLIGMVMVIVVVTLSIASSASAQTAPLDGVYAPCRTYSATPLAHYHANRATRTGSGGSARYFARGSATELTGSSVTLAETGRQFYEKRSSCPVPANCTRSAMQPPSGLDLRCRVAVQDQGTREYDLHAPDNYTNLTNFPLVLEMHGGGGQATPPLTEISSGWREVSDSSSQPFIVVYPVGSAASPSGRMGEEWQTCNYDAASPACPASGYPNDRTFLIEVVKKVVADLEIDRQRIYATGLSSGAAMVHSLACKYSSYFAAVAPMATGLHVTDQPRARDNFDLRTNCNPDREVPHFYVHSPHDRTSSWSLGAASVTWWRTKYGCSGVAPVQFRKSEVDLLDATDSLYPPDWDATVCRANDCGAGSSVAFCEVDGSSDVLNAHGHIVWSGDDFYFPLVQPFAPRLAQWAWDWMRTYSLPGNPSWPPPIF